MSEEEPKRLAPRLETLRELFLKSGNLCAFPNCPRLMMNEQGDFVGELCHIEGVKGERFNPLMTNEERRAFGNLLLMCHDHHVETNNEIKFSVSRMVEIKLAHERRFSRADRAILDRLTDWTSADEPIGVRNLRQYDRVCGAQLSDEERCELITEINSYLHQFSRVPIEVRRFVCKIAERIHRLRKSNATEVSTLAAKILVSDVELAFRLDGNTVQEKLVQLEAHGLGGLDWIDTDLGPQPVVAIRTLRYGIHLWLDVVMFCEATDTGLERFSEDLDFSPFDA